MSNKTTLQDHNTRISDNNTNLNTILQMAQNLPDAGGDITLQEKTVTPTTSSQNVIADAGYNGLSKVTVNAMPTTTQATPSISVSTGGLITASAEQTAGYVSAGTKSATKQLTTKAATTWTPKTSNQTIASGTYLTGTQTIKGDTNLVAGNIKSGVSIFGVTGTLTTSTAEDLSSELTQQDELITVQASTINNLISKLQNKAAGSSPDLTNLFDGTKLTFTNSNKVTTTKNSIIFDNSDISSSTYFSSQNVSALGLKPSTVYSCRCNVTVEVVTSGGGTAGSMEGSLWLQDNATYTANTKYNVLGNNNAKGVVYSTFITPSNITNLTYLVNRTTGYCKTKFENIVILEGVYDSGNFPV